MTTTDRHLCFSNSSDPTQAVILLTLKYKPSRILWSTWCQRETLWRKTLKQKTMTFRRRTRPSPRWRRSGDATRRSSRSWKPSMTRCSCSRETLWTTDTMTETSVSNSVFVCFPAGQRICYQRRRWAVSKPGGPAGAYQNSGGAQEDPRGVEFTEGGAAEKAGRGDPRTCLTHLMAHAERKRQI